MSIHLYNPDIDGKLPLFVVATVVSIVGLLLTIFNINNSYNQ